MYSITLICTRHEEAGKCNSNELYRIIENISPEIIFEEIPPTFFDKYNKHKTHRNLETITISRYLEAHKIEHIPVDSDDVPCESFFLDHINMHRKIEGLTDVNGFDFRTLTDRNRDYIERYGFEYLNSDSCIYFCELLANAIERGIKKLNNEKLFRTNELWKEVQAKRENVMLQNIYKYSEDHKYNKAVFPLGAGHRKSIIQKVQRYHKKQKLKLNWSFYDSWYTK